MLGDRAPRLALPAGRPGLGLVEHRLPLLHVHGVCFLLQTIGQKHTPPQTASIILTLESVFGTLLSVLFYHERLSFKTAAGFVLIFVAVLISETKLSFLKPRSAKRA